MNPWKIAAFWVLSAAAASADDEFRHGRIRYLDEGVTVQRAAEAGAEEAAVNMPLLPGDRMWTDDRGRAEFQFVDGSVLRLDTRSKLDYVAHEEGRSERVVLRLWSGGLMLQARNGRHFSDFAIETPGGDVETEDRVVLRIDAEAGETRVSVEEGEASLDSGRRRVTVEAGERAYARRGEAPEGPRGYDRKEGDDFADWCDERDRHDTFSGDARRYLPEEVMPYAAELESHGSWYYVTEVGNVWRPYVAAGWRPYGDGRWMWSVFGWTWVANESWGWAPSHYGRWGYSGGLGWYWVPGNVWGPAWVSWAVGGDYVGWCPLGRGDRPVVVDGARGNAIARGSVAAPQTPWIYTRKGDMGLRDVARRRVDVRPTEVQALHVAESPRARPSRDLQRLADGPVSGAVPRTANLKPTIGDTVPELRTDPSFPGGVLQGQVYRDEDARYNRARDTNDRPRPATVRSEPARGEPVRNETRERTRSARPGGTASTPPSEGAHPTDRRSPAVGGTTSPRTRQGDDDRSQQRLSDPDRDVLRHIFKPLSEPRERGGGTRTASPRNEPRTAPAPRSQPQQHAAPPPRTATPRATPAPAQPATKKDKSH